MKKIVCILLVAFYAQVSYGQVVLNYQLPPSGVYIKSQLWNLSLIKTSAGSINIQVNLTFTDASNGQVIFTATSGIYPLTQQVTQLQSTNLTPIFYTVVNGSYNVTVSPDGFLPIGKFDACISILKYDNDVATKIAEECSTIEIEPASPPILVSPEDNEPSYEKNPFFNWLPPSPLSGFSNLSYDITLVEVDGMQSPGDAVQQNIPVFFQQSLAVNSIMYPTSLPPLDTSKLYAWQVSAKSSNNAIAKSEVYTFRVRDYTIDTVVSVSTNFYVPLKRENDASYASFGGEIKFEYLNEINDSSALLAIGDITNPSNKVGIDSPFIKLALGENFIRQDVTGFSGMIPDHFYLLEFINSKKEHWSLKFQYKK